MMFILLGICWVLEVTGENAGKNSIVLTLEFIEGVQQKNL